MADIFTLAMCTLGMLLASIIARYSAKSVDFQNSGGIGYRTTWSKKSAETWSVANHYASNAFIISSLVILLSGGLWFIKPIAPFLSAIATGVMLIGVIISIIATENHLRKNFDSNGISKQKQSSVNNDTKPEKDPGTGKLSKTTILALAAILPVIGFLLPISNPDIKAFLCVFGALILFSVMLLFYKK